VIVVCGYNQIPGIANDVRAAKITVFHILTLEPERIVEEKYFGVLRRAVMPLSLEFQSIIVGNGFEDPLEPNGPDLVVGAVDD
jgi:hypothetical protein